MSGRPLRFLGVVLGGWVAARAVLLWPAAPVPQLASRLGTAPFATPAVAATTTPTAPILSSAPLAAARPAVAVVAPFAAPPWQRHPGDPDRVALALLGLIRFGPTEPVAGVAKPDDRQPAPAPAFPRPRGASRLSGSVWLIARPGDGLGASPLGGQLGGSQAGLRVAYAIDRQHRLALVGRVASPLGGRGREGAVGIEWQPTRVPLRLVAEQRVGLDGNPGGPAIGVVGGIGPVPIGDFRLEGYGQAGVIGRGRGVGYADGALRIERPIATRRGIALTGGVGAWGAAQPGAERLDVGPLIGATVPIARQRVRVSIEWRARIGGQAAPGSGIALSLGSDF